MKVFKLFSANAVQIFASTYANVIAFATFYILILVNNSFIIFCCCNTNGMNNDLAEWNLPLKLTALIWSLLCLHSESILSKENYTFRIIYLHY